MRRAMLVVGLLAAPVQAELPTVKAQDAQPPVVEAQGAPSPKTADPAPLPKEEIREIDVVYFQSQPDGKVSGGTSPAKIILKPNPSGEVRVAVYEEFSGGAGNQWRASVWMASFLSSTTLGRQFTDYEFGVSTGGMMDGPSAGALTTAAMMAAINGVPVKRNVTMTGTVNPDGSIGPVGGIPQKIQGAATAGKKAFGYPVGQRYDMDMATQQLADLHGLAKEKGLAIKEVRDIYEAYELLTGQKLVRPQPVDVSAMEISPKMFQRMQAKTTAWQARTEANIARLKQRKSPFTELLMPMLLEAEKNHSRAGRYQKQGMVPAAYDKALEAAAVTEMALRATRFLKLLSKAEDMKEVELELQALASVEADWNAFMIRLATEEPKSAAGTVTQMVAYESAVGAWAAIQLAHAQIAEFKQVWAALQAGKLRGSEEERLMAAVQPLMMASLYFPLASLMLDSGEDILELTDDQGKEMTPDPVALTQLARAYTSAAKANLDYYDALVTEEEARASGKSLAAAQNEKASNDFQYLFTHKLLEFALSRREAKGVSAALANLAAAQASYLGSAQLVTQEYSLGVEKDEEGTPVEVRRDKAFTAMLELAEQKAREMAAAAQSATGAIPSSAQRAYQAARAQREGNIQDKLSALSSFWSASLASQLAVTLSQGKAAPVAAPATP